MANQIQDFSAGHWKLSSRTGREFRIEPAGHVAVAWLVALVSATLFCGALLWPELPSGPRVIFGFGAIAIGLLFVSGLLWLRRHETRRGPYLVANCDGLHLRDDRTVSLEEFASFEIKVVEKNLGDGRQNVSYLVAKCKSGEEIEIVACTIHREIVKLKRSLDEKMNDVALA